jgi:hypothetical protein
MLFAFTDIDLALAFAAGYLADWLFAREQANAARGSGTGTGTQV